MRTVSPLWILVAFIVATFADPTSNGAWKSNQEYRYAVQSKTLTALPNLKNEWVGLTTKADLVVRKQSEDVLIGQFENAKHAEVNGELINGWEQEIPMETLDYKPMRMNTQPFEIRLSNGTIHSIAVDKSMTNTELNHLKGVLSQLQVDLRARNLVKSKLNQLPIEYEWEKNEESQPLYKVMEPTVTGKCETTYDIVKLPGYLARSYTEDKSTDSLEEDAKAFEITKTKDYSKCDQKMGYHFGISGSNDWKVGTSSMGSLSKSGLSRIIIIGNYKNYTIRSSSTTNRVVKENPDGSDNDSEESRRNAMVVSHISLNLVSMEKSESDEQLQPYDLIDVGNLVYAYDRPSSWNNEVKPKKDSSEESKSESREDDSRESEYGEWNYLGEGKNSRSPRSLNEERTKNHIEKDIKIRIDSEKRTHSSTSSESDSAEDDSKPDWNDESREYYQPKPSMNKAPEDPFQELFIGDDGKSIQNSLDVKEECMNLVKEIAEDLESANDIPKRHTLWKYSMLTNLIRTMDSAQLSETSMAMVKSGQDAKHWKTYRDAVANAGTGPSVDEVMNWIENYHIKGEEAAELIANMPKSIRVPTEEMHRRFFNFVKHDAVREQSNLNVTAGFALTRFLYKSQVNNKSASSYYPVETYGRLADRKSDFVATKVIPYFVEELKTAVKNDDRAKALYAIRAMGNLGHAQIPIAFEPYLEGETKVSKFQRLAMVFALDKYTINYPKAAQTLLFKLYQNRGDTNEVRSAAVFQLMRTKPSAELLQRMAQQANEDENKDVRAAVRSALKSAAESKSSKNEQFAKDAKLALSLMKTEDEGLYYSHAHLMDFVKNHFGVWYGNQLNYIVGRDSYIPNVLHLITEENVDGLKRHSEQQAMISSVERLTNLLSSSFDESDEDMEQYGSDDSSESKEESKWSVENIYKMLKMKPKNGEKFEGQVLLSTMGSKRMFAFDEETVKRAPVYVSEMIEHFRTGQRINYTKFFYQDDVTIAFPMETGLPFVYRYRTPVLMQIDGNIQVSTTPNVVNETKNNMRLPETANMNVDVHLVYSTTTENKVGFIDPRTAQSYSAGILTKAQINIPLRTKTFIDMRDGKMETELEPMNTNKTINMVHLSSWPFTARKNIREPRPTAESKYGRLIHVRPATKMNYTFGENLLGTALTMEGKYETKLNDLSYQLKKLYTRDPLSLTMLRQRSLSPEYYSFEMKYHPERLPMSSKRTTKIMVQYASKPNVDNSKDERKRHPRSLNNNDNLSMPDSTEPNSEERRNQLLRDAGRGLKSPKTAVLDIAVEFDYNKTVNYAITVSSSKSKIEQKSRYLLFLSTRTSDQSEPKALYMQVDMDYEMNPMLDDDIMRNVSAKADMELVYGNPDQKTSTDKTKVRGTVQLGQSKDRKEYDRETTKPKMSNGIDYMKAELYLENPTASDRSDVRTIYDYMNHITYSHIKEERANSDDDSNNYKWTLEAELANDMKKVSVKMSTPEKKIEWETVRVPELVRHVTKMSKMEQLMDLKYAANENEDTCSITKNVLKTFGDQTVKHDLGETWHLAVQKSWPIRRNTDVDNDDMTKTTDKTTYDGRVSILVRDASKMESKTNEEYQNDEQTAKGKEILIVLHKKEGDETIKLMPKTSSESSPRLYVDGMEKILDPDQETVIYTKSIKKPWAQVYITRYGDLNLRLKNESMDLFYNGNDIKVKSNSMFRNNRGLCGAYTGESKLDRKSPNDLIVNDDDEYTASWALTDTKSPKKLTELKQRVTEENYSPEEISYGNAVPNKKEKPDNKNKSNADKHKCQTEHQTQYMEKDSQICFSKRPLPVCAPGCKFNGKTTQDVEVHCRDAKDAAAEEYKKQIHRGRSLDMTSHKTTKRVHFSIPKRCVSTHG